MDAIFEGQRFSFPEGTSPQEMARLVSLVPKPLSARTPVAQPTGYSAIIPPGTPVPTPATAPGATPPDWEALRETPAQWRAGTQKVANLVQGELADAQQHGSPADVRGLTNELQRLNGLLEQNIPWTNLIRKR